MLAMGTFIKLLIYVNIDSFNYIIFAQNKTTWVQDRRLWPACRQIEIGRMAMPAN